ncbi:MAG: sigma-70 family RNA polymerase sigma factor [Verrucomicrobiales bacterium]|nr:sigma-70 family RNA polymerase sigma factor [Verrucomicrobiales bacterium]MCP5556995.1 sigma-70 family RNA polymerase sigma factor [Verrucomicrobiaceae bacterium]
MNPLPSHPIDEELAALLSGNAAAACANIVHKYGALVKSACRRVLRDDGLAEDAAQETFVLLMKKARSLPSSTSLAGWLYQAACRTALNHQRTAIRRRVRENSLEAIHQMTPETQPNLWTEIEPHLDEAMFELPERQRDLVVQCYFQNQSQRSAAAALGCSESVVSRELHSAIDSLRQFFTKRRISVSSVALTGLLSTHAASGALVGGAAAVTAMTAVSASTLTAALFQSKLVLAAMAVAGTAAVVGIGFQMGSAGPEARKNTAVSAVTVVSGADGNTSGQTAAGGDGKGMGKWNARFEYTSAMALDELKKQVLLESDPEARYALLQKMGVRLSRAGFDQLINLGMDASVAPWRDTFVVLANRTEMFDNYLMAWSNEDPLAALDWVAAQPDGGLGMRKQLLYAIDAKQLRPDTLREWILGLKVKSMQQEAMIALESINDPSSIIAKIGTGRNDGFLVDLAMVHGDRIDWTAFGRRLAAGKGSIVARAMQQMIEGNMPQQQFDQMIQALDTSPDANIRLGAVAILRAARGDASLDYVQALELAAACERAGMNDFRISIYQGWGAADPQAALQYTGRMKNLAWMRDVIRGLRTLPDDATMLAWMAGTPTKAQDIALAALYGRSTGEPFSQLQKIMQSTSIIDQYEAAQEVMRMVSLSDAPALAEWLKQLPAGEDRKYLALALVRRLAAVDPQTTLDLGQSEGLRGPDYDKVVSNAVTQFSAQNDLAQSTQFIQQIRDPKMYAEALGQIAMVKFAGRPQEAFAYLQANSRGDWQPAALRMLSEVYYNKLGNIGANAAEILKLDLQRLGAEVPKRASLFCKIWIDHQTPVAIPLAWTQQLPGTMGREARLQLAKNAQLKPTDLGQFRDWVQTAAIPAAERTKLLNQLSKHANAQAAR